jgi:hypothetical protein
VVGLDRGGDGLSLAARASRGLWASRGLRRHWPFAVLFAAGLALRVLTQVAYRPALLYIDSARYLAGPGGSEPEGYRVLLRLLDPLGGLALVAAVQHVFGLATAVALYALLIRRGVPRWGAALAAAPVLLDAYQLQLEQTVMPDVLFETMIAAGLALLLWYRRPGPRLIAAGALALGAATTVREIGAVLIAPTIIFALMRPRGGRRAALAAVCFALPVLGYMTAALAIYGHFGLARNGPGPEYGRAAAAADCATLKVPADERALCPSPALTLALSGVDGLLNNPHRERAAGTQHLTQREPVPVHGEDRDGVAARVHRVEQVMPRVIGQRALRRRVVDHRPGEDPAEAAGGVATRRAERAVRRPVVGDNVVA